MDKIRYASIALLAWLYIANNGHGFGGYMVTCRTHKLL